LYTPKKKIETFGNKSANDVKLFNDYLKGFFFTQSTDEFNH